MSHFISVQRKIKSSSAAVPYFPSLNLFFLKKLKQTANCCALSLCKKIKSSCKPSSVTWAAHNSWFTVQIVKSYVSLKHFPHELQKLLLGEHLAEHSQQTFPTTFVWSLDETTLYACSWSAAVQFAPRLHFGACKYSIIGYEKPGGEP